MAAFRFVLEGRRMFGEYALHDVWKLTSDPGCSGAYCGMTVIALLDLPLELPPDAEARKHGHDTFLSGLPEYLSRCKRGAPDRA